MRHLDTNTVIAYLRGNETVAAQLMSHLPEVAVSSLVLAELLYGHGLPRVRPKTPSGLESFSRSLK